MIKNKIKEQTVKNIKIKFLIILGYGISASEIFLYCFWRLLFWLGLFIALWLFNVPAIAGRGSELLASFLFWCGFFYYIWHGVKKLKPISKAQILKRLEKSSGLEHQTLRAAQDKPINNESAESLALWDREIERRKKTIKNLTLFKAKDFICTHDRYALRSLVILSVICGIFINGSHSHHKIIHGIIPLDAGVNSSENNDLTLIITPPSYTNLEQITLHKPQKTPIKTPEGSTLKIILKNHTPHWLGQPYASIDQKKYDLTRTGDATWGLETKIENGQSLKIISSVLRNYTWPLEVIKDAPPNISITDSAKTLSSGEFMIPLLLRDDYGVKDIKIKIEKVEQISDPYPLENIKDVKSVFTPPNTEFNINSVLNYTDHPWAGRAVKITVEAIDHKPQATALAPIEFVLPERIFTHPVAKEIIKIRKDLIRLPLVYDIKTAIKLEDYNQAAIDRELRMALRSAASRLAYSKPSIEVTSSLLDLLWKIALRIEDGNLSLSAQNLREAQKTLEEALNNPDTAPEKLQRLIEEYTMALREYLAEVSREWQKKAQSQNIQTALTPEMIENIMNLDDVANMIEKLRSQILAGDLQAAQTLLSQLSRISDLANPSIEQSLPQDIEDLAQNIKDLSEIIKQQEDLLENTEEQAKLLSQLDEMGIYDPRTKPPFIKSDEYASEQDKIRSRLQQVIARSQKHTLDPEKKLLEADQDMALSKEALAKSQPDHAVIYQQNAIDHLRESQKDTRLQIAQRLQSITGLSINMSAQMRLDPLGRPMGDNGQFPGNDTSDVIIPTEQEKKRVQEIIKEIRQRASERQRPQEQLEYFQRLLNPF